MEGTPLLGIFAPDKIQEDVVKCGLRVTTVTDGPTRVLRIEDNIDRSNRFVNVSRTNWIIGGDGGSDVDVLGVDVDGHEQPCRTK